MAEALPVLYSFRRCPYAMRARLALRVSGRIYEHREVDLRQRPQELYQASEKGTVPVLELPSGEVLEESLDVMRWALEGSDPEGWLPRDSEEEREVDSLIEACDGEFKLHLDRYKYGNRYPDTDPEEHRAQAAQFLLELDRRLEGSRHLLREELCLADVGLLPFVRQFALTDRPWFEAQGWARLVSWLQVFLDSDDFRAVMVKHALWIPGSPPRVVDWGPH